MASTGPKTFRLLFTIGPVQGFVSQARRTRDLWAGSWLLSFLSETALAAAESHGGKAIMPYRSDSQRTKVTSTDKPIGGYPNRFDLEFDSIEQAKAAADAATKVFHGKWEEIANAVWTRFVAHVDQRGTDTRAIWDRQVRNFWEVSWVVAPCSDGPTATPGALGAARKNFRNVAAPEEPGTKCSLMGTHQELSGYFGKEQWTKQRDFWTALQTRLGDLDIKVNDGERLCAIALIKRLFPKVIQEVIGTDLGQNRWPSTAFFAALPWLKRLDGEAPERARDYVEIANSLGIKNSEYESAKAIGLAWAKLDGPAWFTDSLRQTEWGLKQEDVRGLTKRLNGIYDKTANRKPAPYFALLVMDGDSLGKLLGKLERPSQLSQCLVQFADKVEAVVDNHDGRTVYAGGDDVLALLPAENALETADALSQAYQDSFRDYPEAVKEATISGAIVFAHWSYPLRQVLGTGHRLLDDVAKEKTGRDSLAIGIIQGSGLNALWSAPWAVVRGQADGSVALDAILDRFGSLDKDGSVPNLNASYLYHLRQQFSRLFAEPLETPGVFGAVKFEESKKESLLFALAHAEYRRRLSKQQASVQSLNSTRAEVESLMALSYEWKRLSDGTVSGDKNKFGFDGWRVARFLKQVRDGTLGDH